LNFHEYCDNSDFRRKGFSKMKLCLDLRFLRFLSVILFCGIFAPCHASKVCPLCKTRFEDGLNFCPIDGRPLKSEKNLPTGKVEISLLPSDSILSLDGISRGKGPNFNFELPPGEHRLEASAEGYTPQKLKFSVVSGQTQKFSLELSKIFPDGTEKREATNLPEKSPETISAFLPSNPDYSNMIEIKPGSFLLGSERGNSDERPLRRVKTSGFLIDRYEVTCAQYQKFLNAVKKHGHLWCHPLEPPNKDHTPFHTYAWALKFSWVGGRPPSGMEDYPVVLVDWFDAYAYANWCGKRLPSEDEWEIAAGGGDGRDYPWGNNFSPDLCNLGDSPTRVGLKPEGRSPWGVEDMAGNVAEWTATGYEPDARDGKPFTGRFGQPVIRGGSWDDESKSCRISARDVHRSPYYRSTTVGFRCVADLPKK